MKLLVLSVLLATCGAQFVPGYYYPYSAFSSATANQYHAQDELGQASFGYSYPGQASATYRDAFGNQVGSYAYFNADGKEVRVSYVADANGFRVLSNDLPVGPSAAPVAAVSGPEPVQDTAEVAAAKAEHARLWKEAADAAAAAPDTESRKKRQVFYNWPAPKVEQVVAKTTFKTAHFEKDEAALTPAATVKIDLKDKEHEVETPLGYKITQDPPTPVAVAAPLIAHPYAFPFYSFPAPVTVKAADRKKRQVFYNWPAPKVEQVVAKTTFKTAHFEKDEAALTPAATVKVDLKEKEHEVETPLGYKITQDPPTPVAVAAPLIAHPYAFPFYSFPAPVTVKAADRKKRQVFYNWPAPKVEQVVATHTFKTAHFEKNEAALTPAATVKIDLKEQEHKVETPLGYKITQDAPTPVAVAAPLIAHPYSLPFYSFPAPVTVKAADRKKRQVFYNWPAPKVEQVVAKHTFKTQHFEKDDSALTPSSTYRLGDLVEKTHEIETPLGYKVTQDAPTPVAVAAPYIIHPYLG